MILNKMFEEAYGLSNDNDKWTKATLDNFMKELTDQESKFLIETYKNGTLY